MLTIFAKRSSYCKSPKPVQFHKYYYRNFNNFPLWQLKDVKSHREDIRPTSQTSPTLTNNPSSKVPQNWKKLSSNDFSQCSLKIIRHIMRAPLRPSLYFRGIWTKFRLMFYLGTPWKRQKTGGFLMFSKGKEKEHWSKMVQSGMQITCRTYNL